MNHFSPALCLALALFCGSLVAQEPIKWQTDLTAARKAAQQYGVPVLIHFYGDNCLPCKTLEQRVFSRPEVSTTIHRYFIPVHINASVDRRIAAEFQVHSWPTDVFVSPDGKTLSQGVSMQDPNVYLQNLQNIAIMNRDRSIMLAAELKPATGSQTGWSMSPTNDTSLANKQNPYGLLPAANSIQVPARNFAPSQSNVYTLAAQQNTPSPYISSLPPVGQANASSNLANSVANAQSASRINTPQPSNVQRGPVDVQTQPSSINGAIAGTTFQFSAPNLPPPAQTMQSQYVSQTQPFGVGGSQSSSGMPNNSQYAVQTQYSAQPRPSGTAPAWQGQSAVVQLARPNTGNGMPNMIAQQTQSTAPSQAKSTNSIQPRGLLVSNPHYPGAASQSPSADTQNSTSAPQTRSTVENSSPAEIPVETSLILDDLRFPSSNAANAVPNQPKTEIAASPTAILPTATSSSLAFQPVAVKQPATPNPESAAAVNTANSIADSSITPTAALDGYCPVALIMSQQWIAGQESFAVKHRGHVYHLSSQPAMEAFLASPDSYTPVLSGYDPMVFLDHGRLVPGTFEFGSIDLQTHAVYLFSSQADKDKFETDFEANSKALNILISSSRTQAPK